MTDNLVTTGLKTTDRRSNSQAADVDYEFQTIDEEEGAFVEFVEGDPLEFGINNNQLSLDEVKDICRDQQRRQRCGDYAIIAATEEKIDQRTEEQVR